MITIKITSKKVNLMGHVITKPGFCERSAREHREGTA